MNAFFFILTLKGLLSDKELNGVYGTVDRLIIVTDRWNIILDDGVARSIKPENLEIKRLEPRGKLMTGSLSATASAIEHFDVRISLCVR